MGGMKVERSKKKMEYPKGVIIPKREDDSNVVEIDEKRLVAVSFYLDKTYDWILVKDDIDIICLVPLKKIK